MREGLTFSQKTCVRRRGFALCVCAVVCAGAPEVSSSRGQSTAVGLSDGQRIRARRGAVVCFEDVRKDGRARRLWEVESWVGERVRFRMCTGDVDGDVEERQQRRRRFVRARRRARKAVPSCRRWTCKSFGLCVAAWCSQSLLGEKKKNKTADSNVVPHRSTNAA